jgi:hypothetical protein
MPFNDTTQANRTAIATAARALSTMLDPTLNSSSLRGVRNEFTDADVDAKLQALADALHSAGYVQIGDGE